MEQNKQTNKQIKRMEQGHPWEANNQLFKKSPPFMEPERSLPYSQEPAIGPYPEPDASSPQLSAFFL